MIRSRREPPPFRVVEVVEREERSPHMARITLTGSALAGFDPGLPAASLRLLLPSADGELEVPVWQGNEFLLADGTRPLIRTLTPARFDADRLALDVEIVRHGVGPLSDWAGAAAAATGDRVAVSGTGRGYEIDPAVGSFVLVGDESALPAISTLTAALPAGSHVRALIEIRDDGARLELPGHPRLDADWLVADPDARPGDALLDAIGSLPLDRGARVWAAGEAAAMHRLRRHLFDERALPRAHAVVRGYWKVDRCSGLARPASAR
jgi:NADPH-dependent ferric siderophore reductase